MTLKVTDNQYGRLC